MSSTEPFGEKIIVPANRWHLQSNLVFAIFEDLGISVDCVATSEVSVSVSLDPSKIWSRELIQQMASSEQSGERTVLGDLTNSIIINGSPVPSSSQATPVDPKELRRQKDREKYAQMDINKKEEFLKKRREARQKRKVGVARVNQNQHSTCMVQDNEDNTEQEVPTNDVGTKHRNVDGPCTDHEGAKRKQNKATSSTYSKEKKSQQDRERYAKMDENKKN